MNRTAPTGLLAALALLPILCSCGGNTSSLSPRNSGLGSGFSPRRPSRTTPDATATATAVPTRIAFVSNENGHPDVWLMDSDGSHRTGVTNDEAVERSPHWADGGRSLVFIREAKDKTEIVKHYLPDNADRTIVTLETEKISQLTASPASALVAFVVKAEEGTSLQVVPLEDAKSRKLMAVPATASVQSLCWLGDGHTLALVLVQKDPQPPVKASSGKSGKEGKAKT